MGHQLIVIGNGFDLACGLKSSFRDFFETRFNAERKTFIVPDEELTAWDVILSTVEKDDPLWCDVESLIAKWVVGDDGNGHLVRAIGSVYPEEGMSAPRKEALAAVALIAETQSMIARGYYPGTNGLYEEAFAFLLSELRSFERTFAEYLRGQTEGSEAYQDRVDDVLGRLVFDELLPSSNMLPTSVMSFNYTPVLGLTGVVPSTIKYRNIHGSLGSGDIVIGIDGKGIKDDSLALPFTKTYRLLALDPVERGSLVHTADSENPTTIIKFYGHSLAKADYSYFQSIFDAVNLYGSDVTLIFYYSGYKDGSGREIPDEELRTKQYVSVCHLLTTYGETLDNSAHGDNLMHKLLLEGRLFIKRL